MTARIAPTETTDQRGIHKPLTRIQRKHQLSYPVQSRKLVITGLQCCIVFRRASLVVSMVMCHDVMVSIADVS